MNDLTLTACPLEAPVDDWWSEEPLRHCDPDRSDAKIANCGLNAPAGEMGSKWRSERDVSEDEEEECQCCPEPADLDEVDVEDVALFREVTWCLIRSI